MKIFRDLFVGDELFSDVLPHTIVDGCVYKVEGKYITDSEDVNISNNDDDGGSGGLDESVRPVINVVSSHKLQPTSMSKKQYESWLKKYISKLLNHIQEHKPQRAATFQKEAQAYAKKILSNFKEYDFYTGESMSLDCQIVLLHYGDDGMSPTFYFWSDGLVEQKLS